MLNKDNKGAVATAIGAGPIHKIPTTLISEAKELPYAYEIESSDNGLLQDLLSENKGIDLISEKFKVILDGFNEISIVYNWLSVKVEYKGKTIIYYTPRFFNEPDVLDKIKTRYGGGNSIVVPCFSKEKVSYLKNTNLFYFSRIPFHCGIGGTIVVSERVKKKLTNEGITGVAFEKAKAE